MRHPAVGRKLGPKSDPKFDPKPAAVLWALLAAAGCLAETLEQPASLREAVELDVHPVAPPADKTELALHLREVPYCPDHGWTNPLSSRSNPAPVAFANRGGSQAFDPDAPFTRLKAWSAGTPGAFGCDLGTVPMVRFFQPALELAPWANIPEVPWEARDSIIAYSTEPARYSPFGPTGRVLDLPAGYSVLRRVCDFAGGPAEPPWQLRVGTTDEPIDFHAPASLYYPQPIPSSSVLLEQSERALVEGCGTKPPVLDLGRRLAFDRALSLALSSDGGQVTYLVPIDRTDIAQGAALRAIDVASGAIRQVAIIPYGRSLQVTDGGDIYVGTQTGLVAVTSGLDGTISTKELPISPVGVVSPDGRWIAADEVSRDPSTGDVTSFVKVWDVGDGTSWLVPSLSAFLGWSPASLLVAGSGGSPGLPELLYGVDPVTGEIVAQLSEQVPSDALGGQFLTRAWGLAGPVLLYTRTTWTPEQSPSRPLVVLAGDGRDFGLVLRDLRGGGVSPVLDVDAGAVSFAATTPGTALVWARKCLGLFQTVCTFALHRVALPSGDDQIVAVADTAAPVAVSRSTKRIAIAASDGIYLRDPP